MEINRLIPAHVHSILQDTLRSGSEDSAEACKPVVIMTCGISGAGKSTFSHAVVAQYQDDEILNFTRLSIDHFVFLRHGLYGQDYAKEKYEEYNNEAESTLKSELRKLLLEQKQNVVLDLSFYSKAWRDEYKRIIGGSGARWMLVYFQASKEVLQRRVQARKAKGQVDGDSSYDVTEEILDRYISGFEKPSGEGEIVVDVEYD